MTVMLPMSTRVSLAIDVSRDFGRGAVQGIDQRAPPSPCP